MYADSGVMFPYFRNFSQEIEELEEFCYSQKPTSPFDSIIVPKFTVSDYDLGGEVVDLFNGSEVESIIEEKIDPITAALDIESLQYPHQVLRDPLGFDVSGMNLPPFMTNETEIIEESKLVSQFISNKCGGSSVFLNSMPNFLDFPKLDFNSALGMRRAFSEGDIKVRLQNNSANFSEDRLQKLCRYRNKKARRNFGRKIKYACRKALADSQPRIRGRFAKNEDAVSRKKR